MDDAEKTGYMKVVDEPEDDGYKRIRHLRERGGCGADITASCFFIKFAVPILQVSGNQLVQSLAQVGATVTPMVCPECKLPMIQEHRQSPIQVARGLPVS